MLENVGRKVALIVILLLVSLGLMLFRDEPFSLGLDLQGGTRLVYSFDFDAARARGDIGPNEDQNEILVQTQNILLNRINPTGAKDVIVRREGTNRLVLELPGNQSIEGGAGAESTLGAAIGFMDLTLTLGDGSKFPSTGVVGIGDEEIRYNGREGNTLHRLQRGHTGQPTAHEAGVKVRLVNADSIRSAIENLGELAFLLVAEEGDFAGKSTDLTAERSRLTEWQGKNQGVPVEAFNLVPPEQGGPDSSIRWYRTRFADSEGAPMPVLLPRTPTEGLRGEHLERIYTTVDDFGYPAVGFQVRPARIDDFADFTGDNINRRMAIVLNDEVRSAPRLNSRLTGGGIIEGRFQNEEVKSLVTVLRSGSLKLKPTLESDERVSATLGDDYVRRGVYSSVLGLVIVVAFMVLYYRRLGVFSALALITNLIMFMGGLAFLRATLTLPGIAGIILTVGMAVDANILIFDRLREEAEKGRNPKQAAKAGFEKAFSAIIDSNVTTFLSALILYELGTGPVRGFAVTLMIGILTSVFAALVTTRVFVHWALAQKTTVFKMGRWMADANFDFLGKTKIAMAGSILVCVGGLVGFIMLPDAEKLGIDFTGGVEAQLQTAKAEDIETLREKVKVIPGIGESAEVKGVLNYEQEGGGFTRFRLTFKTDASMVGEGQEVRPKLHEALKDLLLADAVQVKLTDAGDSTAVELSLVFEQMPGESDLEARLEGVGIKDPVIALGDRRGAFTVTGTTALGRDPAELKQAIAADFARSTGGPALRLSEAIPGFTQIGPQVVGTLRDNALLALALSLFITVLYIRVRFAEYSYGIAAMVALVHDVLVTLAALTVGNLLGIVNGEMNLAMIAVFLTIIGYSVNDTIVIFDRVRENLPRSNAPLREVLNTSINETLSRTIMTSLTVFLVIVVQYLFNLGTGNVLESISFAMLFGTLSGVYSTVYIANPVFLWLETRTQKGKADGGAQARARREEERKRLERERPVEGEDDAAAAGPATP